MQKRVNYWDIIQLYHQELYKSKLYWTSAVFILVGVLMVFCNVALYMIGVPLSLIGVILLIISKLYTLRKEVKI